MAATALNRAVEATLAALQADDCDLAMLCENAQVIGLTGACASPLPPPPPPPLPAWPSPSPAVQGLAYQQLRDLPRRSPLCMCELGVDHQAVYNDAALEAMVRGGALEHLAAAVPRLAASAAGIGADGAAGSSAAGGSAASGSVPGSGTKPSGSKAGRTNNTTTKQQRGSKGSGGGGGKQARARPDVAAVASRTLVMLLEVACSVSAELDQAACDTVARVPGLAAAAYHVRVCGLAHACAPAGAACVGWGGRRGATVACSVQPAASMLCSPRLLPRQPRPSAAPHSSHSSPTHSWWRRAPSRSSAPRRWSCQ